MAPRTPKILITDESSTQKLLNRVRKLRAQGALKECISLCEAAMAAIVSPNQRELRQALKVNLAYSLIDFEPRNPEYIERAISILTEIEQTTKMNARPLFAAGIARNLSRAYVDRTLGNRKDNLQSAKKYYTKTLKIATKLKRNMVIGRARTGLAEVYLKLAELDCPHLIEKAIFQARKAREVFAKARAIRERASLDCYLWQLYRDKKSGNMAKNQELSIRHYTAALTFFTRKRFPEVWAVIQEGLGISYSSRRNGDKRKNLLKALSHYKNALRSFTPDKYLEDHWRVSQRSRVLSEVLAKRKRGKEDTGQLLEKLNWK